jgi:hypothetical protein
MRAVFMVYSICMAKGQSVKARLPPFGISSATLLRDLEKSKSDHFGDPGLHGMPIDPELHEIFIGHGKLAIILSAVARELYLHPLDHLAPRSRENVPSW